MTVATEQAAPRPALHFPDPDKQRRAASGDNAAVLADIYADDVNIAIWRRELSPALSDSLARFMAERQSFQASMSVSPQCALASVRSCLAGTGQAALSEDIAALVEMFCSLFDLSRAGLRLATLDQAMCPRFHVDKVPCRLVTTYYGVGSEWLPHAAVNRARLGPGSQGLPDSESGLMRAASDIRQLGCGHVALLKGELWEGNENAGLVHRSPAATAAEPRLLLTLDFSD